MAKLSWRGIALGALTGLIASLALAFPLLALASQYVPQAGLTEGERLAAIYDAMREVPTLYLLGLFGGGIASVLAGFVAARIARRSFVLNGAVTGALIALLSFVRTSSTPETLGVWQHISFALLAPGAGALGGFLKSRRSRPSVGTAQQDVATAGHQ